LPPGDLPDGICHHCKEKEHSGKANLFKQGFGFSQLICYIVNGYLLLEIALFQLHDFFASELSIFSMPPS